ncbi:hypothetical protein OK016_11315 [Vibrio chagasii]|nr:hypothetical protein [Vibrio chagasii]
MSNYIGIGDIQGCFDELNIDQSHRFNQQHDTLWVAGDLIWALTSLETLRFIRGLGDSAKVVLGNHDLLAVSLGLIFSSKA